MGLLPDRPSIEYLRKQAKDLLGVLRESDPGASLADAQRALAAEYGERDWPALKAEVERRLADTPAAPDGLAEALAGAFGLGDVTAAATPVSFTPMGRCWGITTDRGRWLAVTVFDWITAEQAELGARLGTPRSRPAWWHQSPCGVRKDNWSSEFSARAGAFTSGSTSARRRCCRSRPRWRAGPVRRSGRCTRWPFPAIRPSART
ncbi:hypothetical protein OG555_21950 [Kribbella sp. NBC_01484]|uniref:hypothetical protein n=1 Tax=Kribbella sp. NBC_01484 TaxID=2903579 RepID=UPI002E30454E|nr:hypothetical protein [Kribbella sp. NBC_01484]